MSTQPDDQQKKATDQDEHTGKAVVERGKKAIEAAEQSNNKDKPEKERVESRDKDAEQWRNEG